MSGQQEAIAAALENQRTLSKVHVHVCTLHAAYRLLYSIAVLADCARELD